MTGWGVITGGSVPLALLKLVNLMEIDGHFRGLYPNTDFSRGMSASHQIMIKLSQTHHEGVWRSGRIAVLFRYCALDVPYSFTSGKSLLYI